MSDLTGAEQTELEAYRVEDLRQREWAAGLRESDVRCDDCDLRYGERDAFACSEYVNGPHCYDEDELAKARELDPPTIPRATEETP